MKWVIVVALVMPMMAMAQFNPADACYMPSITPVSERAACMKEVEKEIAKGIAQDACVNMGGRHMSEKQRALAHRLYGWNCVASLPSDFDYPMFGGRKVAPRDSWIYLEDKYLPWR